MESAGKVVPEAFEPHLFLQHVFSANVRLVRTMRKLSQEELADLAGVDRTYVSSIERGLRNVSIQNIQRLAIALQVEARDLVDPALRLDLEKVKTALK